MEVVKIATSIQCLHKMERTVPLKIVRLDKLYYRMVNVKTAKTTKEHNSRVKFVAQTYANQGRS
jgi:hypothetical protein